MGTGYVRDDVSDNIASGKTINAADLDGEFDAIEDAFDASTGHTHDGTSAEGGPVTVVGPAQEYVADGSDFYPKTDDTYDLGKTGNEWKDLYIDGVAYLDEVDIDAGAIDGVTIGGNSAGAGTFTTLIIGSVSIAPTSFAATILDDADAATVRTTLELGGIATTDLIDEDNMVSNSATRAPSQQSVKAYVDNEVGSVSIATLSGTLAEFNTALSNATFVSTTGSETLTNKTLTSPTINTGDINNPDIDGGTIDNTVIGGNTPEAGTFTGIVGDTLGLGSETSPSEELHITAAAPTIRLEDSTDSSYANLYYDAGDLYISADAGDGAATSTIKFLVDGTEVADLSAAGTWGAALGISHLGDTDNRLEFSTDTQNFQTGGSSRLDISNSGVRLGGANARVTTILDSGDTSSSADTELPTVGYLNSRHVLATEQATTSGTAIDFTGIGAGAKAIHVMFRSVELNAVGDLLVQLGDSGGIEDTGYFSGSFDDIATTGFMVKGDLGGDFFTGLMTIRHMGGNHWVSMHGVRNSGTSNMRSGGGGKSLSGELTQIRLTRSGSGTFADGAVNIQVEY